MVSTRATQSGDVIATIKRECCATIGDKFSTCHGQPGVVTVIPDSEMPKTDASFVPGVIIGSNSIIGRCTLSQVTVQVTRQRDQERVTCRFRHGFRFGKLD